MNLLCDGVVNVICCRFREYLKDHDRIKENVCSRQPNHEICGDGDGSAVGGELGGIASREASGGSTLPPLEKLSIWAWQNLVVYVAGFITVIGLLNAMGCFEKSLSTKIADAQLRAMQPIDEMMDADS